MTEFDLHADNYDQQLHRGLAVSGERKEFFARGRVEWLSKSLNGVRGQIGTVLDYGCGVGDTSILFDDILQVDRYLGLDVSDSLLQHARSQFASQRRLFLSFSQYVPEASIDLAYCNGVFHHIPVRERGDAVDYIFRCLRPGGMFSFWENNPWNPGTQYVMYKIPFDRGAIKISPPEAVRLLRSGGFEIIRTDFRFFFPAFLRGLRFLESRLSRVPFGAQYQVLVRKPEIRNNFAFQSRETRLPLSSKPAV